MIQPYLEEFDIFRAKSQSRDLHDLVTGHPDVIDFAPGAVHRYGRSLLKSAYHVIRSSLKENHHAFILRDEMRLARGIGTIIGPQLIVTQSEQVNGYNIDYWTVNRDPDFERFVVDTLTTTARELDDEFWHDIEGRALSHATAQSEQSDHPHATIYATFQPDNPYNPAITERMVPQGPIGVIRTMGADPMQIAPAGLAQLYVAPEA